MLIVCYIYYIFSCFLAFYTTIALKSYMYIPLTFSSRMFSVTCLMHFCSYNCHAKYIQYNGSCAKVLFPDLKQACTTSIALYSLSIIGETSPWPYPLLVPSSVALATASFPSLSSDKFAISSLDHPYRSTLLLGPETEK